MMKKTNRFAAMFLIIVMSLMMSMPAFAQSKKEAILSSMVEAATELGIQNSKRFKNAYACVEAYEEIITEEDFQAALAEIQYIKNAIAEKGVDFVSVDKATQYELADHLIQVAAKLGITVVYYDDGIGEGWKDESSTSKPQVSNPIKQTGADFTMTLVMIAAAAAVFVGCVVTARKRQLFA